MKFLLKLLFPSLLLAISTSLWGQTKQKYLEIIQPAQASVVKNGNLFIEVRISDSVDFDKESVKLFIDGKVPFQWPKVVGNKIVLFSPFKLRPGRHDISVSIVIKSATQEWREKIDWLFYIDYISEKPSSAVRKEAPKVKDSVLLRSNINIQNRNTNISGPGSSLRQEPDYYRTLNADFDMGNRKWSMFGRVFLTSDEYTYPPGIQSRNFMQFGFRYKGWSVLAGDVNPVFDQLMLTGPRVKGGILSYQGKGFGFKAVHGTLQRAKEGRMSRFEIGIPPVNVQNDSSYAINGLYRREITALQITFGNIHKRGNISFHGMRTTDVANSIEIGGPASQNLVAGASTKIVFENKKTVADLGVASSYYTADTRGGAMTKEEYDSIWQLEDNTLDPKNIENFFVINKTTLVTSKYSVASFVQLTHNFNSNHSLFFGFNNNMPAFYSNGNPFYRRDIRQVEVQERFFFFKRKLSGFVRYAYEVNNLDGQQFAGNFSNFVNGALTLRINEKIPMFSGNFGFQNRRSSTTEFMVAAVNMNLIMFNAMVSHRVKLLKAESNFSIAANQVIREDLFNSLNQYTTTFFNFGYRQQFTFPLSYNITYQFSQISSATANGPLTNYLFANLNYNWDKLKSYTTVTYIQSKNFAFASVYPSIRPNYSLRMGYLGFPSMDISVEAGYSENQNKENTALQYEELYLFVRYTYRISKRL